MEQTDVILETEVKKPRKLVKIGGLFFYGLLCSLIFTFFKIPDDRIYSYIDGVISSELSQKGISFTAMERHISFIFGPSYTLKDVTIHFPDPYAPQHIKQIQVSISLLPLLIGRTSGKVLIRNENGELKIFASLKNTEGQIEFKATKLDLAALGFHYLTGIQGSAIFDGKGLVEGNFEVPSSLEGHLQIQLSHLLLESQKFMGFILPKINVSHGEANILIEKAQVKIKEFKLGEKERAEDDVKISLSGDIMLSKQWALSQLNLQTRLSLSENALKSFILLDAILGGGKQADGSYRFSLTGPIYSPMPLPLKD